MDFDTFFMSKFLLLSWMRSYRVSLLSLAGTPPLSGLVILLEKFVFCGLKSNRSGLAPAFVAVWG